MATYSYYVVCDAYGPISVGLSATTESAAIDEFFDALDRAETRKWIDDQRTDLESALGVAATQEMKEEEADEMFSEAGATPRCHLGDSGWYLWAIVNQTERRTEMAIELNVYRGQQEFGGQTHELAMKICPDCEAFWRDNGAWFTHYPQTPAETTDGVCDICGAGGDEEWTDAETDAPRFTTLRDAEQHAASGLLDLNDYTDEERDALTDAAARWLWGVFSELADETTRRRGWEFYREYCEEWLDVIRASAGLGD